MLTAVGAATWPTGDHVWNSHIAARTPNPKSSNGKTNFWTQGAKCTPCSFIRSKV